MPPEIPPEVVAKLDQISTAADEKYCELIEALLQLTEEHGEYPALAIMSMSLMKASIATLTSIVVTGMIREMRRVRDEPSI